MIVKQLWVAITYQTKTCEYQIAFSEGEDIVYTTVPYGVAKKLADKLGLSIIEE